MNQDPFDIATLHPGWIASAVLGMWAFGLRLLIGRHYKAQDVTNARLCAIENDVAQIKGRLQERDRYGHHTWPGDTE